MLSFYYSYNFLRCPCSYYCLPVLGLFIRPNHGSVRGNVAYACECVHVCFSLSAVSGVLNRPYIIIQNSWEGLFCQSYKRQTQQSTGGQNIPRAEGTYPPSPATSMCEGLLLSTVPSNPAEMAWSTTITEQWSHGAPLGQEASFDARKEGLANVHRMRCSSSHQAGIIRVLK